MGSEWRQLSYLLADAGVRMDLLEHLVNVGRVRFGTLLAALAASGCLYGLGGCFLGRCFGHGGNEMRVGRFGNSNMIYDSLG